MTLDDRYATTRKWKNLVFFSDEIVNNLKSAKDVYLDEVGNDQDGYCQTHFHLAVWQCG